MDSAVLDLASQHALSRGMCTTTHCVRRLHSGTRAVALLLCEAEPMPIRKRGAPRFSRYTNIRGGEQKEVIEYVRFFRA